MHQIHGVEIITWRKLPGNKLSTSLHAAMLTPRNYRRNMVISPLGSPSVNKRECSVVFDREYALSYIARKLVKPLQNEGYDGICELVADAWELLTGRPPNSNYDAEEVVENEGQSIMALLAQEKEKRKLNGGKTS
jgi:hypothetical protein